MFVPVCVLLLCHLLILRRLSSRPSSCCGGVVSSETGAHLYISICISHASLSHARSEVNAWRPAAAAASLNEISMKRRGEEAVR